jgi:formate transporter
MPEGIEPMTVRVGGESGTTAAPVPWRRQRSIKILETVFPFSALVAVGFEHCVANMYFVPLGLLIERGAPDVAVGGPGRRPDALPPIDADHFLVNLGAVTLGNWIGGAVLVGGAYWFIHRCAVRATH